MKTYDNQICLTDSLERSYIKTELSDNKAVDIAGAIRTVINRIKLAANSFIRATRLVCSALNEARSQYLQVEGTPGSS